MIPTHPDLANIAGHCALILGDVMLDEYLLGDVQRVSPEAPVPVVEVRRRSRVPGGAANVACNVASLNGRAMVVATVGADAAGGALSELLTSRSVDASGLVVCGRRTTTKTRVIAHQQQVVRFDEEDIGPLPPELEDRLYENLAARAPKADVCVISDYAKGVVPPSLAARFIALARTLGKPIVVDPKSRDFTRYRNATVVTPNLLEARLAAGIDTGAAVPLSEIGRCLVDRLGGSDLLITRGAEGMSLFTRSGVEKHIPSVARSVFDVTGAGDTMVSMLALALAAGKDIESAAYLANVAAGLVVGHFGTSTTTLEELERAIGESPH